MSTFLDILVNYRAQRPDNVCNWVSAGFEQIFFNNSVQNDNVLIHGNRIKDQIFDRIMALGNVNVFKSLVKKYNIKNYDYRYANDNCYCSLNSIPDDEIMSYLELFWACGIFPDDITSDIFQLKYKTMCKIMKLCSKRMNQLRAEIFTQWAEIEVLGENSPH